MDDADRSAGETAPFNPMDYLDSAEDVAGYLAAVIELNDHAALRVALGHVVRSGRLGVGADALGDSALSALLHADAPPQWDTMGRALAALGLKLSVTPRSEAA